MGKKFIKAGLCIVIVVAVASMVPRYSQITATVSNLINSNVIVIDPGHGGIDGGAQSSRGVCEKEINLQIALKVKELAEKAGWKVIMTREEDEGLYEEGSGAIRSLKTQDLKARREIIEKNRPELAVSIHLNSFKADTSVKGPQIFYPGIGGEQNNLDKSKKLAKSISKQVAVTLGNRNQRAVLPKQDVYLFKQVSCPITIIECGFLSNAEEAECLQDSEYQEKLAQGIYLGMIEFSGKKPPKPVKTVDSLKKTEDKE